MTDFTKFARKSPGTEEAALLALALWSRLWERLQKLKQQPIAALGVIFTLFCALYLMALVGVHGG